ncbi:peptidyl-prolyl cis-trans isomerase, FKBP-type domain-containing protein [Besnoitia besnoiti]|uniref:peptidylprolyl isomerase n=1 Tax=Besnoitia besnoiti TaxID=94643 RepID=A0A2A9MHI0_BESBE|nr:peptidyl-prolyl cis-trans isomerase, FKBP-type domain-containing protein [Besnoitia besnoiti]PFH34862.1 peptidyl-prolyl cis-trans isomerase, FKBP-type domain-containing protein [Besnoitia besnoiti]
MKRERRESEGDRANEEGQAAEGTTYVLYTFFGSVFRLKDEGELAREGEQAFRVTGPVLVPSASSPFSFNAEQGRLCFTGALLVPLSLTGKAKRSKQSARKGSDAALPPPPRVLLSVRTLRRGTATPLMILDENCMQGRCKILFEEDAQFSLTVLPPSAESSATAWGVQLLGDNAPHPCSCCDMSGDEEEEEEAEGKKRKRHADDAASASSDEEAPELVPAAATSKGAPLLVAKPSGSVAAQPSLAAQLSPSGRKKRKLGAEEKAKPAANKAAQAPSGKEQQKQAKPSEAQKARQQHQQAAAVAPKAVTQKPAGAPGAVSVGSRVALPSGVSYEVTGLPSKSAGGKETASHGDRVSVQYKGLLAKSLRRFDSGRIKFVLGRGEVIKGMELGVKGMRLGESRRILIPSALGYGKRGAPPTIPPHSDLIFEVRLMTLG